MVFLTRGSCDGVMKWANRIVTLALGCVCDGAATGEAWLTAAGSAALSTTSATGMRRSRCMRFMSFFSARLLTRLSSTGHRYQMAQVQDRLLLGWGAQPRTTIGTARAAKCAL